MVSSAIAFLAFFVLVKRPSTLPRIHGWVAPGFEAVKEAFEANFRSGWDSKGAAFTVFQDGVMVADLYGGYANAETLHEWEDNTMANIFSCGKGVVAIAVAMLVDRLDDCQPYRR